MMEKFLMRLFQFPGNNFHSVRTPMNNLFVFFIFLKVFFSPSESSQSALEFEAKLLSKVWGGLRGC